MDSFKIGAIIRREREKRGLTQAALAEKLGVSSKAVSKWETACGLPDISLIEPLAKALSVSVAELMSGQTVVNKNASSNLLRSKFYVCPICGNIIRTVGDAVISCCGTLLPPLEAEDPDDAHKVTFTRVEDECFLQIQHEMTKEHYISFAAYLTCDKAELIKFYPEGNAETRIRKRGNGFLFIYCNRHGLMKIKI